MKLDPTFLSTYIEAIQTYPLYYNNDMFDCVFLKCGECPLQKDSRCYIALERDRLIGDEGSASDFEQTYVAPTLLQTHPELFI